MGKGAWLGEAGEGGEGREDLAFDIELHPCPPGPECLEEMGWLAWKNNCLWKACLGL